mmetsp:Transcript_130141/g.278084  ORF Transcript_130141/g.278084 Transcript_130141/m.278084 type:complete len:559 (-) Transcript_130141:50-1726(-)
MRFGRPVASPQQPPSRSRRHDAVRPQSVRLSRLSPALSPSSASQTPQSARSEVSRPYGRATSQTPRATSQTPRALAWGGSPPLSAEGALTCDTLSLINSGPGQRVAPIFTCVRNALLEHRRRGASSAQSYKSSLILKENGAIAIEDDHGDASRCQSVPLPELSLSPQGGAGALLPELPSSPDGDSCPASSPSPPTDNEVLAAELAEHDEVLARGRNSSLSRRSANVGIAPGDDAQVISASAELINPHHGHRGRHGRTPRQHICDLAKSCRKRRDPREGSKEDRSLAQFEERSNPASPSEQTLPTPAPTEGTLKNEEVPQGRTVADLTVYEAYNLAEAFNLPCGQVTHAWKLFKRYDSKGTGRISSSDFILLIRAVLRDGYPNAKDVPRELFDRASLGVFIDVGFKDFLDWMTENAFSEHLLLTEAQRQIRKLARRYNVPVPLVEAVKKEFDRFDSDGSGKIEFEEFYTLLIKLFSGNGVKVPDLPMNRVKSFWREIDMDGSGVVDFMEFIPWYVTYFIVGRGSEPLEEYYRNIRPVPVRRYESEASALGKPSKRHYLP